MFTKSSVFAFFTAILLGAAHASGQPSAADKAVADKLFEEGRALLDQNRLPEACQKFEESDRHDPSVGTRLNLGDCHERQGKTASAYGHYGDAARLARERGDKPREGVAEERRRALEKRLSRVRIVVPSSLREVQVHLDGKFMGPATFGTAIPVDPGKHEVQAWAPGRASFLQEVQVGAGPVTVDVEVPELFDLSTVVPKEGAGEGASRPSKPGWSTMRDVGFVLGIVGFAGVGVGAGFGVHALQKNEDSKGECEATEPTWCTLAGASMRRSAGFSADMSTLFFGVGGAVLATGVVLFVVGGNEAEPKAPVGHAWVSPMVGAGSLGVVGGMEF